MPMKKKEKLKASMGFIDLVEHVLYSSFIAIDHETLDNSLCLQGKLILNTEGDQFVRARSLHEAILKPSDMVGRRIKSIDCYNGKVEHIEDWRPSLLEISRAYKSCKLFANRFDIERCSFEELLFQRRIRCDSKGRIEQSVLAATGWSERKQRLVTLGDLAASVYKGIDGNVTATGVVTRTSSSSQAAIYLSIVGQTWWRLLVSASNSPRLVFHSTPKSVLALLSNRDLENSKSRRDALLHWVRSHERSVNSDDEDAVIQVREHLRGKRTAIFGDVNIEIVENVIKADEQLENIVYC